ncbi:hypothetical protein ACFPOG_12910 [Paenibacillus aestuarii]|uniref:Uncharacterized protein n=1 Tax=Paenibacillus aestuarii TaxID=516965 RepID=A0ABW0K7D4_9BACL
MENNNQTHMDNVIDMFFKRDEEVTLSETIEQHQTGVGSDLNVACEEATATEASKVEEDVPLFLGGNGQFSLFGEHEVITQDSNHADVKDESCGSEEDTKNLSSGKKSTSIKSPSKKTPTTGSTLAVAAKPKKDQNLEVDDTWTIHYATENFRVTDFVNPLPASGKVKLEELRIEMEKEYFEFTKDRVRWDYDDALKRLYPDVSGTSKGCGLWH